MKQYEVLPIVCDYGVYEDLKLKLICNSRQNAYLIKEILEKDQSCDQDYNFEREDYDRFHREY